MARATDKTAVIRENLSDAGLNDKEVAECLKLIEQKRFDMLDRVLTEHRRSLLDSVHKYNSRIDCLDFLTYTLKKNGGI